MARGYKDKFTNELFMPVYLGAITLTLREFLITSQNDMEKKTNIWKWLFLAVVFGVVAAGVWEFAINRKLSKQEAPVLALAPTAASANNDLKIKGNKDSRIYHLPNCPNYQDIADRNVIWFKTHDEAKQAGFRMARNC
jgi:hypothetical protein